MYETPEQARRCLNGFLCTVVRVRSILTSLTGLYIPFRLARFGRISYTLHKSLINTRIGYAVLSLTQFGNGVRRSGVKRNMIFWEAKLPLSLACEFCHALFRLDIAF